MKTTYEWIIETLDKDGEITEVNHSDTFPGMPAPLLDIGIVKDIHATVLSQRGYLIVHPGDLICRTWAYIKDGVLPSHFEDGTAVPMRFHREIKEQKKVVA